MLILLIIGLILEPKGIIQLIPNLTIAEMFPLLGLISIFLLLIAWIKPLHKKEMIIATILVILQGRFIVFLPFIYAPSLIHSIQFLKNKYKINFYYMISFYALIGILAFCIIGLNYFPAPETQKIVFDSTKIAVDQNIILYNDWELGYLVRNQQYDTKFFSSWPNPDYNKLVKPFYALTNKSLDCETVYKTNEYTLFYCEKQT